MNDRIFIGSSSEGLEIANQVRDFLVQNSYDCSLWNDGGLSALNTRAWDSLLLASLEYDYGVMVMTKDDVTISRGKKSASVRDNILFEFGLFLGRLDYRKTFVLVEQGIKLPSDFNGVSLSFFDKSKPDSLTQSLQNILRHLKQESSVAGLHFVPSTILALSYYDNFLYPVCCCEGKINSIQYDEFEVYTLLPEMLQDDLKNYYYILLKEAAALRYSSSASAA